MDRNAFFSLHLHAAQLAVDPSPPRLAPPSPVAAVAAAAAAAAAAVADCAAVDAHAFAGDAVAAASASQARPLAFTFSAEDTAHAAAAPPHDAASASLASFQALLDREEAANNSWGALFSAAPPARSPVPVARETDATRTNSVLPLPVASRFGAPVRYDRPPLQQRQRPAHARASQPRQQHVSQQPQQLLVQGQQQGGVLLLLSADSLAQLAARTRNNNGAAAIRTILTAAGAPSAPAAVPARVLVHGPPRFTARPFTLQGDAGDAAHAVTRATALSSGEEGPAEVAAARPAMHPCPVCNKLLSVNTNLTTHMRTHNGDRPFRCDRCPRAFAQRVNLKRHLRTHTGERPFHCDNCQERFARSTGLRRHRCHAHSAEPQE
jgi:hypothetical protein